MIRNTIFVHEIEAKDIMNWRKAGLFGRKYEFTLGTV